MSVDKLAMSESTGEAFGGPLDDDHVTESWLASGVRVGHVKCVAPSGTPLQRNGSQKSPETSKCGERGCPDRQRLKHSPWFGVCQKNGRP